MPGFYFYFFFGAVVLPFFGLAFFLPAVEVIIIVAA